MNTNKYKAVFMGTPDFAVPVLEALINHPRIEMVGVVTASDRQLKNGKIELSPVKQRALEQTLPVFQPEKIRKDDTFLNQLRSLAPDLIVVAAYGKILPQTLLDLPRYGAINVHPSLLPKYRGASPVVGAVLSGDKETGVSIIKMSSDMDAGDILKISDPVPIQPTDTAEGLIHKLFEIGAEILTEIVVSYIEGGLPPIPQDASQATYVDLLTSEDGKVDWDKDEQYIERMIRAYQPWPGVYTMWQGKRLKILSAEFAPSIDNPRGNPLVIDGDLYIGKLKILRLQLEGKKPVSGEDFLRGYPDFVTGFVVK